MKRPCFKPRKFEESEIKRVLSVINEVGEIARSCAEKNETCPASIVNNSPLFYIEGILRYQLTTKQKSNKKDVVDYEEKYGVDVGELIDPSDFIHMSEHVEYSVDCSKVAFLFGFLMQIVKLSYYPELIDCDELEKVKSSLRSLTLLTQNQLNAKVKSKDIGFEVFFLEVWKKLGSKEEISSQRVWDRALNGLRQEENKCDIEMNLTIPKGYISHDQKDPVNGLFVVRLINESDIGKEKIEVTYPKGIKLAKERPKSFSAFKNIWPQLNKDFFKNK